LLKYIIVTKQFDFGGDSDSFVYVILDHFEIIVYD